MKQNNASVDKYCGGVKEEDGGKSQHLGLKLLLPVRQQVNLDVRI